MRDPLFFTAVRGLNIVGFTLFQAVMLLGSLGWLAERACADDPLATRVVFGLSLWIACSNTLLVIALRALWTRRRADVLHQRGVEIIDGRKGR
jgi:hypothetical protein